MTARLATSGSGKACDATSVLPYEYRGIRRVLGNDGNSSINTAGVDTRRDRAAMG